MSGMDGHNPTDLESQDAQRLGRQNVDALARQRELDDIHWLMRHKTGRRLAHRALAAAGVTRTAFNADARCEAFNLGQQNSGYALLAEINTACPSLYITMLMENSDGG